MRLLRRCLLPHAMRGSPSAPLPIPAITAGLRPPRAASSRSGRCCLLRCSGASGFRMPSSGRRLRRREGRTGKVPLVMQHVDRAYAHDTPPLSVRTLTLREIPSLVPFDTSITRRATICKPCKRTIQPYPANSCSHTQRKRRIIRCHAAPSAYKARSLPPRWGKVRMGVLRRGARLSGAVAHLDFSLHWNDGKRALE